ncbi:hypothetical protein [Terrisporobacter sp.]|uniref:hypothetical protein n=1 Tax=Terrisporobacter sp. TaxID=1965305 RepID=UPI00289823D7|nr:hypothetical protein [Terrisporobacter sp.]
MTNLNFNNIKKTYMTVTLPDDENTKLMIMTPTKAIMDKLIGMEEFLSGVEVGPGVLNDLYDVCAEIMNRNKAGRKITTEYISEILDLEDLIIFFNAYLEYVGSASNSKN